MTPSPLDSLRKPFFIVAMVLIAATLLVELGAPFLLANTVDQAELERLARKELEDEEGVDADEVIEDLRSTSREEPPPGLGIPGLAFIDVFLVFAALLMGLDLLGKRGMLGLIQGVAGLVLSLATLIIGILFILAALAKLFLMLGLFLSPPFGTIAYLATWGFFDRAGAGVTLSLLMLLKLASGVLLVLAHQRFLRMKGLVFLFLLSLLGNVIVSLLHGIVPIILVSITDAAAAIIVAVIGLIVALPTLISSLVGLVRELGRGRKSRSA